MRGASASDSRASGVGLGSLGPRSKVAPAAPPERSGPTVSRREPTVIAYLHNSQELRALVLGLPAHHLRVVGTSSLEGFTEALRTQQHDVVLMELALPAGNLKGAKELAAVLSSTRAPTIVLVDEDQLQKSGLLSETADFLIKPFSFAEAVARISRTLQLRQTEKHLPAPVEVGDLELDPARFKVWIKGEEVHFSYKEFELLRYLLLNEQRVLTRSDLLRNVWGYNFTGSQRTVDVHVRRLRSKMATSEACAIETVVNVGYKFVRMASSS